MLNIQSFIAIIEVILVDDHSTDRTADIILSYAEQGVKLLQLKENKPLNYSYSCNTASK